MTIEEIRKAAPEGANAYVYIKAFNLDGSIWSQIIFYKIKKKYNCIHKQGVWNILKQKDFPFRDQIKPLY